jgi:hypothetical protein
MGTMNRTARAWSAINLLTALTMAACAGTQAPDRSLQPASDDWERAARRSVATVDVEFAPPDSVEPQPARKEPGTGFVVAWHPPLLYVVTAGHVLDTSADGRPIQRISIGLDPEFCGERVDVTLTDLRPNYRASQLDLALLPVRLPERCATFVAGGKLRRLSVSPLQASARGREGALLQILGRGPEGAKLEWIRRIKVNSWTDARMSLDTSRVFGGMSGAPLFSDRGELVGMVVTTRQESSGDNVSREAFAIKYDDIKAQLRDIKIQGNMAADFAELVVETEPPDVTLWVDGYRQEPRDNYQLKPGPTTLKLEKPDYPVWTGAVTLEEDCSILRGKLPSRWERRFAAARWPLWGLTAGLTATAGLSYGKFRASRNSFYEMPSRARLDEANRWNTAAVVAGGLALLSGGLAVTGEVLLDPMTEPAFEPLRRCR